MRSQKVRLRLTKEQTDLVWWYSKVARNYWNLLVGIDNRNSIGEFDSVLESWGNRTYFSKYFNRDIYKLSQLDYVNLVKVYLAGLDSVDKFSWYFVDGQSTLYNFIAREFVAVKSKNRGKVNFRSINEVTPSFPVRCDSYGKRPSRIYQLSDGSLQIPSLGRVKIGSTRFGFDLNCKKQIARVSFDGKYWYLSYVEPVDTSIEPDSYSDGVGIDLGIKNLATMSNGVVIPNISTFRRIRILCRRLKIAQRKLSYKYECNKDANGKFVKTKNIIKLERKIKLIHRNIRNIRVNHIREFVSSVVKKNPMYIAIEDLNVKGMLKNKHLAKDIANCSFYAIREQLIRKARERHILVRLVDRFYPSSKTCSSCGYLKRDLKLSQRVFNCDSCNTSIDRDFNASLNLKFSNNYTLA